MKPEFGEEKANDLIREVRQLAQQIAQLEKRAVFELVQAELHIEPAALAEKLAGVVRDKAARAQTPCPTCNRPLGDKRKCMYCGTERKAESIFDLL
jgi:hypothetical protein